MNLIISPRRQGKTTELIKKSAARGGYILCSDIRHAHEIAEQAKSMGLVIPFPLTFVDYQQKMSNSIKEIYIDNLDLFIHYLFSSKVETATMSLDNLCITIAGKKYSKQLF